MSLEDSVEQVGVWRAVGEFKLKEALWPEGLCALVVGVGGSIAVIAVTAVSERTDAMADLLFLSGAFLAVVFTALAIVVSIPSRSYLQMLGETPEGGMRRFLDPFLVAVGTQISLILLAIAYRFLGEHLTQWVEHVVFALIGFLFVFGTLDMAALARQLVRHGVLRAADEAIAADEERETGSVRRLPAHRG